MIARVFRDGEVTMLRAKQLSVKAEEVDRGKVGFGGDTFFCKMPDYFITLCFTEKFDDVYKKGMRIAGSYLRCAYERCVRDKMLFVPPCDALAFLESRRPPCAPFFPDPPPF